MSLAQDCLIKQLEGTELDRSVLSYPPPLGSRTGEPVPEYCDQLTDGLAFLAASPAMIHIRRQVLQIAPVDVPVFISGESGVGKEVVARMIHERSNRRAQPFVKVNCAALPGELLESELFGYEQGAFTGAIRPKPGRFELANHGTIFLDEIAEMEPHLQAKLLQVLQDNQYSRLGGSRLIQADVRILAASNVCVPEAMKSGRLRSDLYYRLSVLGLHLPPLRDRITEVPMFFRHFVKKYARQFHREPPALPEEFMIAATRYSWPGNLRELENFVKRYVILDDQEDSLRQLVEMVNRQEASQPPGPGLKKKLRHLQEEVEGEAIAKALERTHWSRKKAASDLGISYKTLLYKMRRFNLVSSRAEL